MMVNTPEQDEAAVDLLVKAAELVADETVESLRSNVPRWRRWAVDWERDHLAVRIGVVAMVDKMRQVDSVEAYRMVERIVEGYRHGTD